MDCHFCLGKDLPELKEKDYNEVHFSDWKNLKTFLCDCYNKDIGRIYITGQTTDPMCYKHLGELVDYVQARGFRVGLRTNGIGALKKMEIINRCKQGCGYTLNAPSADTELAIRRTLRPRVSTVVTRDNVRHLPALIQHISRLKPVRYIQVRKVSTHTRTVPLQDDQKAFNEALIEFMKHHPRVGFLWKAPVFRAHGKDVVFWPTVETSANSWNYFVDGTISKEYEIIKGYLRSRNESISSMER
jgi:MoaA/NifB/PqqE/SkfB family radical SAM enzyme